MVNATLEARDPAWWGEATSTASDSKRFASWDSNLMTEFHARYGGPGVMIYWHVERNRLCIYSQLKSCSSSEVAAMIEGVVRHCTERRSTASYVDSHGAIGQRRSRSSQLLGFRLLPRLKIIGTTQLSFPDVEPTRCLHEPRAMLTTRPIRWEMIARSTTRSSSTRPRCASAPRRRRRSCAGSPEQRPEAPVTTRSRSSERP